LRPRIVTAKALPKHFGPHTILVQPRIHSSLCVCFLPQGLRQTLFHWAQGQCHEGLSMGCTSDLLHHKKPCQGRAVQQTVGSPLLLSSPEYRDLDNLRVLLRIVIQILQGNAARRTSQWRGQSSTTRRGLHKTAPRALWFQVQHLGALYQLCSLSAACCQPR
jgi:hypothetical protein